MSRQLNGWDTSAIALLLTVGLWLSVMCVRAWGTEQAPRPPQGPPVVEEPVPEVTISRATLAEIDKRYQTPATKNPKVPKVDERRYDVRQTENGRWFAVVDLTGSGEFSADEVWDVLDRLNSKPAPPQSNKASCNCSPACTCGCQQGEECTCSRCNSMTTIRVARPAPVYTPIFTTSSAYYRPTQIASSRRGGSC